MKSYNYYLVCLLCCLLTLKTSAQDKQPQKESQVEITTTDGNLYKGTIITTTLEYIVLKTENLGDITIKKSDITQLENMDSEDMEVDPNGYPIDYHGSTHYLANPTGYTLKKGQSYYQNIGVFFNSYSVGITDRFSLTMGGEIASLLFGGRVPILFVSPRYSFPLKGDNMAISLGATFFTSPQDDFVGFGVLQTAFTFGNRNTNFTLGGGIGFSTGEGFESTVVPFYPSFMIRLSDKVSFVSDNFIIAFDNFNGATGVISAALRFHFIKSKGSSIDLGLFRPTEDVGDLVALPFVSATVALK